MNWRVEKRTLRHDYAAGQDEHFVPELTPYEGMRSVANVPNNLFLMHFYLTLSCLLHLHMY